MPHPVLSQEIDLIEVTFALSDALDLVALDKSHHGKHTAYIALSCCQLLGWDKTERHDMMFASMLHDCGISNSECYPLDPLTREEPDPRLQSHCVKGEALLNDFAPFSHLAPLVRWHHTPWHILQNTAVPPMLALQSNAINLASLVDDLISSREESCILAHTDAIREKIARLRHSLFAPELVAAFLEISQPEAFWLMRQPEHLNPRLRRFAESRTHPIDLTILSQLARMFGGIVDAKSPFTAEHSVGVARLSNYLGQLCHLPRHTCDLLEIAGHFHDIGKLRVPDAILNKPGKLDPDEMAVIRRHSFDTYQILNSIRGLWDVSEMAAFHHETPEGQGYPFHIKGPMLSLECRIVAVSDVFQALAQERPYRPRLQTREILPILQEMATRKKLDEGVVNLVAHTLDSCYQMAIGTKR